MYMNSYKHGYPTVHPAIHYKGSGCFYSPTRTDARPKRCQSAIYRMLPSKVTRSKRSIHKVPVQAQYEINNTLQKVCTIHTTYILLLSDKHTTITVYESLPHNLSLCTFQYLLSTRHKHTHTSYVRFHGYQQRSIFRGAAETQPGN